MGHPVAVPALWAEDLGQGEAKQTPNRHPNLACSHSVFKLTVPCPRTSVRSTGNVPAKPRAFLDPSSLTAHTQPISNSRRSSTFPSTSTFSRCSLVFSSVLSAPRCSNGLPAGLQWIAAHSGEKPKPLRHPTGPTLPDLVYSPPGECTFPPTPTHGFSHTGPFMSLKHTSCGLISVPLHLLPSVFGKLFPHTFW